MSRIALGTAQFGLPYGIANQVGKVPLHEAELIIKYANDCKISFIDTAIAYGDSETCLGSIGVKSFKVVTKLPPVPESIDFYDVPNWINHQVHSALNRLGLASLYGVLLHKPNQLLTKLGMPMASALIELKERGLIEKLGVSIYAPEEIESVKHIFPIELVQAPFNVLDRRLLTKGFLQTWENCGIELHARSTFLQGLLLMPMASIPSRFSHWNSLLRTWNDWLCDNNISALQACLAFTLSQPEFKRVVVGVDSVDQLREIVSAAAMYREYKLPDIACDDINLIDPSRWKINNLRS